MEHTTLYRKYRPSRFKEVIGQEHVTDIFSSVLKAGNIPHAMLFFGPRGTGKTSVARILAHELGVSGSDLYEIDAASNRGVDDVRALRESVRTMPFESPYKIYIVDEAHMLTREAFNALLKTLEEPPAHVIFILATTEMEKLPDTVVSRCEVHTFRKPPQSTLREFVVSIAKKEGYSLEPSASDLIAFIGDGSYRDTLGALQKVSNAFEGKHITSEIAERVLGIPQGEIVNGIISAIAERDLEKGLQAVNGACGAGFDIKMLIKLILHKMRIILLLRHAKDMEVKIKETLSEEDFDFLKDIAGNRESFINSRSLCELLNASILANRSHIPQLPLELALVKLLGDNDGTPV